MNIFYLSDNPIQCAAWHCDKHTVKMILEYAQLLSTTHHVLDGQNVPVGIYKKTHVNHPSAIWVRQSTNNYIWLHALFYSLCLEYTHRYGKIHATSRLLDTLKNIPSNLVNVGWSEPPQCMPDEYKVADDSITAYRNYYRGGKAHLLQYTNRNKPEWL